MQTYICEGQRSLAWEYVGPGAYTVTMLGCHKASQAEARSVKLLQHVNLDGYTVNSSKCLRLLHQA